MQHDMWRPRCAVHTGFHAIRNLHFSRDWMQPLPRVKGNMVATTRARARVCVCVYVCRVGKWVGRSRRYTDATAGLFASSRKLDTLYRARANLKRGLGSLSQHVSDKVSWETRLTEHKSNLAVGYEIGSIRNSE